MNTLSLKISGCPRGHASVLIDGKKTKLKFNQYGNFEGTYTTDKSSIELSIYKYLEINGKLWFLMSLVFFFVGILGILDPWYDKSCIVFAYQVKIDLNETCEVKLALNRYSNNGRAYEISTECKYQEITNVYYVDNKAKKRLKIMKFVKFVLWILAVALIVWIIAKRIG